MSAIKEKLSLLTRKQRSIYEEHLRLFEAIFNHKSLDHIDPDILDFMEKEQREYILHELVTSSHYRYKKMSIKGTKMEVDRAIQEDLDSLVEIVVHNVKMLEEEGVEA